ncbi:hypothetical protein LFL96_25970 [Paraburkholderia sp. D15]|uniref:hypothetical protein n=1 Tax=Paraburkholderia sp. D15 TaxID=2880218 RepID=UPI002479FEAC|nr:hypothetical protein [Paraburkholderia sp. D15]WGS54464.1 hypothetical protein LFL96_25970 [Paraburkholderia sp. D15]
MGKYTVETTLEIAEKLSTDLLNDKTVKTWKNPKFANDTRIYINHLDRLLDKYDIDYSDAARRTVKQIQEAKIYFHVEKQEIVIFDNDKRAMYVGFFIEQLIKKIA